MATAFDTHKFKHAMVDAVLQHTGTLAVENGLRSIVSGPTCGHDVPIAIVMDTNDMAVVGFLCATDGNRLRLFFKTWAEDPLLDILWTGIQTTTEFMKPITAVGQQHANNATIEARAE